MSEDRFDPEVMAEAIRRSGGVLAEAARMVGCTRKTMRRYRDKFEIVQEAWDEENEVNLDGAECRLVKFTEGTQVVEIDGKEVNVPLDPRVQLDALKFYLRTKGKERGFSERHEITGADGSALKFQWSDDGDSD